MRFSPPLHFFAIQRKSIMKITIKCSNKNLCLQIFLPCSSSKPPSLKGQYSIVDDLYRKSLEQLIERGIYQQGQFEVFSSFSPGSVSNISFKRDSKPSSVSALSISVTLPKAASGTDGPVSTAVLDIDKQQIYLFLK